MRIHISKLTVLPYPKVVSGDNEKGEFERREIKFSLNCEVEDCEHLCSVFNGYAEKMFGEKPAEGKGGIEILYDDTLTKLEQYTIDASGDVVTVRTAGSDGLAAAFATLLQMIEKEDGVYTVPAAVIDDWAECNYRGLMLDLARQKHTMDQVLKFADMCFFYKVKHLHLHFIDSQSYTLPSDAFPRLPTEGWMYTKEEIANLVKYADDREIIIIPEFEAPGHSAQLILAEPEHFASTDNPRDGIICAGKPGVFDKLDALIGEMCDMFPSSPYIHIGGDEAAISMWDRCSDCRRYMAENNISGVRELYTHFICKMTDMVFKRGRIPMAWEGFPKEGTEAISRDLIVFGWESYYHMAYDLVEEGFDIINASWEPMYITKRENRQWTEYDVLKWDVYSFINWNPKSEAHLNPIHLTPTDKVLGGELCVWECDFNFEVMPVRHKLPALAERTWSIRRRLEDEEYAQKWNSTDKKAACFFE